MDRLPARMCRAAIDAGCAPAMTLPIPLDGRARGVAHYKEPPSCAPRSSTQRGHDGRQRRERPLSFTERPAQSR